MKKNEKEGAGEIMKKRGLEAVEKSAKTSLFEVINYSR